MGWRGNGIEVAGSGKTVRKNQLSLNGVGIKADGVNTVTYNVATGNGVGVKLLGATTATRNATSGNMIGFEVMDGFTGTVEENNRASRHEGLPHLGPEHAVARDHAGRRRFTSPPPP